MIVGTRGSELALAQTQIFIQALNRKHPDIATDVCEITSSGDMDLTSSLDKLNGFGAFVRELDNAILSNSIDVSVNSMKDMPIDTPKGLCIPAVLPRASVEDVILPCGIDDLQTGAVVGTSSIRRAAMLRSIRPDIETKVLRGNVRTRLSKLDDGGYDAIILAKAGMERLSIERSMSVLSVNDFIPAPAQGAIAIVCRSDDKTTRRILRSLDDRKTRTEVTIERRLMKLMGAGCSSPIGIYACLSGDIIRLRAISFEYTERPIKIDMFVPADCGDEILMDVAKMLKGERM